MTAPEIPDEPNGSVDLWASYDYGLVFKIRGEHGVMVVGVESSELFGLVRALDRAVRSSLRVAVLEDLPARISSFLKGGEP